MFRLALLFASCCVLVVDGLVAVGGVVVVVVVAVAVVVVDDVATPEATRQAAPFPKKAVTPKTTTLTT